jgi:hypothetical protein
MRIDFRVFVFLQQPDDQRSQEVTDGRETATEERSSVTKNAPSAGLG